MCLIVHKPRGLPIGADLLEAAASLNPDGWGLMGFSATGDLLLERHARTSLEEILEAERRHRGAEYVLHLRRRTRGAVSLENTHPFKVINGVYLMHNGTLRIDTKGSGKSDSWHFVTEVLRPLAQRREGVLFDNAFHHLLEISLRPENKLALLSQSSKRIVLINQAHGAELDGLWLSSTRWIDRRLLQLTVTPQPQERSFAANELHYI